MRYGDRVRLVKSYGQHDEPQVGAEGVITFTWPDGMHCIQFNTHEQEFGYRPADLEPATPKGSKT